MSSVVFESRTSRLAPAYLASLRGMLDEVDLEAIDRVTHLLRRARDNHSTVFVAGNGGSAATASHWVNDLGKATKRSGCGPIRAMSLVDSTPWLSALANDEGYHRIFAGQLENFAAAEDVLIVISASGNSENLIEAVEFARQRAMTAVGLLGFDGGKLRGLLDDMIWVRSEPGAYELVEDVHSAVTHAITRNLIADRPEDI